MVAKTINTPTSPIGYVSVNKNRQKIFLDNGKEVVFLNNKQEFQLEFFNPTSKNVMAMIYLNGTQMSNQGLVIKPGQRIWLDRFIDTPDKLLFDTYEVGDSEEVKKAIERNGHVRVEFFSEADPLPPITPYQYPYKWQTRSFYSDTTGNVNYSDTSTNISNTFGGTISNTSSLDSLSFDSIDNAPEELSRGIVDSSREIKSSFGKKRMRSKKVETGRIEHGNSSAQQFENVNLTFNSYMDSYVEYQILPFSQKKSTTINDIKRYCSSCGKKCKQNDNFCTKCGTKL